MKMTKKRKENPAQTLHTLVNYTKLKKACLIKACRRPLHYISLYASF